MSTSTTTLTLTPTSKTPKPNLTKTIVIRLRPELLAKFPTTTTPSKPAATPSKQSNTTDAPTAEGATPDPDTAKKKNGAKPGVKRNASTATLDNKAKARPGPKKKPRLADGTIDRLTAEGTKASSAAPGATNSHRLGPKANMGAINAGLRALDRSGKACRKWERKGFHLKSFTGVSWGVGSWAAPVRTPSTFGSDAKSDSSSTADVKPTMESSMVPSESSRSGDLVHPVMNMAGISSSPASVTV